MQLGLPASGFSTAGAAPSPPEQQERQEDLPIALSNSPNPSSLDEVNELLSK